MRKVVVVIALALVLAGCARPVLPKVEVALRGGMLICRIGAQFGAYYPVAYPGGTPAYQNVPPNSYAAGCGVSYSLAGNTQVRIGGIRVACVGGKVVPRFPWNCVPY